jgi:hypothetical protein
MSDEKISGIIGLFAAILVGIAIMVALTPPGQKMMNRINQQFSQIATIVKRYTYSRKKDPKIRKLASALVSSRDSNDSIGRISDIFRFVTDKIRYVNDPVNIEHLSDPVETLYVGAGDCDCKSMLLMTLLESIGYKCFMVLVKPTVDVKSARILEGGHAFAVVSIADPSTFIEKEPNATLMVLCDGGTAIKYVTPLESTAYGAYIGWLAEGVKKAIQEGRYILVDPDTPSITDHNLSLRTL